MPRLVDLVVFNFIELTYKCQEGGNGLSTGETLNSEKKAFGYERTVEDPEKRPQIDRLQPLKERAQPLSYLVIPRTT